MILGSIIDYYLSIIECCFYTWWRRINYLNGDLVGNGLKVLVTFIDQLNLFKIAIRIMASRLSKNSKRIVSGTGAIPSTNDSLIFRRRKLG